MRIQFSIKFDRYADLMVSLMAEDCRYLLHTLHYDEERFAGPPHSVSPKVVHELFSMCIIFLPFLCHNPFFFLHCKNGAFECSEIRRKLLGF